MTIAMVAAPIVSANAASCTCSSSSQSCCGNEVGSSCCQTSGQASNQGSCCSSRIQTQTNSSCCQQDLSTADFKGSDQASNPCESCSSCQGATPAEQFLLVGQHDQTLKQLAHAIELPSLDVVPAIAWHFSEEALRPSSERPARVLFSVWLN